MTILADHNIEGQAALLWEALRRNGWLELLPLRLLTFVEVGLPHGSSDRAVWRFAQAQELVLLTDNRNREDEDSLEQTILEESASGSLPVLTIGRIQRMVEREYRDRCATRLCEIMLELDNYRGTGRIYIP